MYQFLRKQKHTPGPHMSIPRIGGTMISELLQFPLVIIVDDEEIILHLVAGQVAEHNCNVLRFTSSKTSLIFLQQYPGLSLLVTDVEMKEMTGPQLVGALTPNLWVGGKKTVIYMTGNSQQADDMRNQGLTVLDKPIETTALFILLRTCLAAL